MIDHRYTAVEASAATGMTKAEIQAAADRLKIAAPVQLPENKVRVLPYPGGRQPRIGFRDGAIRPQRESKLSVLLPWDSQSYLVVDVREAIWWIQSDRRELMYLAHTHVETTWDQKGERLHPTEWERTEKGWKVTRRLPNGVEFGCRAEADERKLRLRLWLHNGSPEQLTGLVVQNCMMLAHAAGVDQLTNANKLIPHPFAASHDETKS